MPWNDDSNPGPWGANTDPPRKPATASEPAKGDAETPKDQAKDDKSGSPWAEAARPHLPHRPPTPSRPAPRKPELKGHSDGPQMPGPDIDELGQQLRQRFGHLFASAKGHGLRREVVLGLLAVVVVGWGLTGLYVVQPEEQAVVTRFGQFVGVTASGLNYHLPAPIEKVEKVSTASVRSLDIGAANGPEAPAAAPVATDASTAPADATVTVTPAAAPDMPSGDLMLTGDENIVDLNFTVQWQVKDAAKYLFRLSDPDSVVKTVAQSAMREVVGQTPLQDMMTTGRGQLQTRAAALMQSVLDSYGAGVTIVEVQVRGANPPREVISASRDVINAGQDAETAANQAAAYHNRVVNEAKGDADKIVQDAQGYQQQSVLEAQGDAARFTQLDAEYRRAPALTRQRLYLETMQRVLAASNKVIVDTPKGSTAPIVLPSDIFRHGDTAPAVVQPPAAPAAGATAR